VIGGTILNALDGLPGFVDVRRRREHYEGYVTVLTVHVPAVLPSKWAAGAVVKYWRRLPESHNWERQKSGMMLTEFMECHITACHSTKMTVQIKNLLGTGCCLHYNA
jgi:hypothetical protein